MTMQCQTIVRSSSSVTVVVGRFDKLVRIGLTAVLRDDSSLRLVERDLEDVALEGALIRWAPQVTILAETAELTLVERLRSLRPQTGVVVVAHNPSPARGLRLLAAGANCVALSTADVDLVGAVHRTARGERFFAASNGEQVERRYPPDAEVLTKREREVLVLLAKGASYSEIALALGMGVRTAEKHAARIFRKLRVRCKRELIGIPIPPERI